MTQDTTKMIEEATDDQVRAVLQKISSGDDWFPIEDAPRDGVKFLILCGQTGVQKPKTRQITTKIKDGMYEGLMFFDEPTHWKHIDQAKHIEMLMEREMNDDN